MRNNKGVTLIAVVVMIIIIIIISTVSIVAAPKLFTNAKAYVDAHEIESVRAAISARKSQVDMQGSITPKDEIYVGTINPLIAGGQIEATGWYMLNDSALEDLGVKETSAKRYLVNYDKLIVIAMDDESAAQQYLNYMFMDKVIRETPKGSDYVGKKLSNNTATQTGTMIIDSQNTNGTDMYGEGWYVVLNSEFISTLTGDYTVDFLKTVYKTGDNYLVNYTNYKFVKVTGTMQEKSN